MKRAETFIYQRVSRLLAPLLIGVLLVLVALFGLRTMTSIDSWWHLAEGRYIVQQRTIPEIDIFRDPPPAQKTINHEWLAQVLFYLLYRAGGVRALNLLLLVLVVVTFLSLSLLYYDRRWYSTTPLLFALVLLVVNERFAIRPHLFTLFLASLFLTILLRYQEGRCRRGWLFLLPFLQMLWVNLHGGFIIGLFLLGVFTMNAGVASWRTGSSTARGELRLLSLISLSALGFCLVNPHAYHLFYRLYRELHANLLQVRIFEWQAPFSITYPLFPDLFYHYKFFLGVWAVSLFLNWRGRRFLDFALTIPLLGLSLLSMRYIGLFTLLSAPLVIRNLHDILHTLSVRQGETEERSFFPVQACVALAFLVFALFLARDVVSNNYYVRNRSLVRFGIGASALVAPQDAVDFLQDFHPPGRLFHTLDLGGYLMWRLYPRQKVFIDSVSISVDPRFVQEYFTVLAFPEYWETYSQKYGIQTVFLTHFWPQAKPLLAFLARDTNWKLIYFDDMAAIFVRQSIQNRELIRRFALDIPAHAALLLAQAVSRIPSRRRGFFAQVSYPLPLLRLGDFFRAIGFPAQALAAYRQALAFEPSLPQVHLLLATLYAEQGRIDEAIGEYKATLRLSDQYPEALYALAGLYQQKGLHREAVQAYTRFLRQWRGDQVVRQEVQGKLTLLRRED
ncbi:MAG: tetratricopeptide repeat protein [Nitrospinota bacterium]|nr:MAG: tetratricopeptide repeat protein [Nitrospinota bacterium]